jgi:carboxypeptidase Taq
LAARCWRRWLANPYAGKLLELSPGCFLLEPSWENLFRKQDTNLIDDLNHLKSLAAEIYDIQAAIALLSWDQQTYMPPGGAEDRGDTLATLSNLAHQKITSPEMGQLLEDLRPQQARMDPDSDDTRLIKITRRQYEKRVKVSSEWVKEFAKVTTMSHSAWEEAKSKSDFSIFQPHLEKVVSLRRDYSSFFAPYDHVYDPQLDDFEPGMKTAEVQMIFDQVRPVQVSLIKRITAQTAVDDSFMRAKYDEKDQWNFGVEVISRFGYDWDHGRQDKSVHPFTQELGIGDVRITTRVDPNRVANALFGTMHEAGHALYELGVGRSLRRTFMASGASTALHESQSRMWENLVGKSLAFWKFFYPRFQELFPVQVEKVSLATFYRGINKVQPSFIRVEADEATYNLHIMLRLELEIALLDGSLSVKDLPQVWNQRMRDYLGVIPPNDALGVLQDVHWSDGLFGYFPTYALGNLVSVQLWEVIQKDLPDLDSQLAHGEFGDLLSWLRQHVHRFGAKYEPQELVQKITGSKINPQPYLRYLQDKYRELYHL